MKSSVHGYKPARVSIYLDDLMQTGHIDQEMRLALDLAETMCALEEGKPPGDEKRRACAIEVLRKVITALSARRKLRIESDRLARRAMLHWRHHRGKKADAIRAVLGNPRVKSSDREFGKIKAAWRAIEARAKIKKGK